MAYDPLDEATDPTTDPERLGQLAYHEDLEVHRAAMRNPSLPEDVWREALLDGEPEAWSNPMAPFYILAWTPRNENDPYTPVYAARLATEVLWEAPERCSPEGKALIAAKIQEWWATSEDETMIAFLGGWVRAKGSDSIEHKEVMRITILCVRTDLNLTAEDRQALDLLEAWAAGGKKRHDEANFLASTKAVKDTILFARNISLGPGYAYFQVVENFLVGKQGTKEECYRFLTDLIRKAMPLPPVVAPTITSIDDFERMLNGLRGEIAAAVQKQYDAWDQDEDGFDEDLGSGGICDSVASEIWSIVLCRNLSSENWRGPRPSGRGGASPEDCP
jgi:hypothetical protein